jgi:rare lipoprotein A
LKDSVTTSQPDRHQVPIAQPKRVLLPVQIGRYACLLKHDRVTTTPQCKVDLQILLEQAGVSTRQTVFTIFLLAKIQVLMVNACMTSQTREPRISVRQALFDEKKFQLIRALATALVVTAAIITAGQVHAASPITQTMQVTATQTAAPPARHFSPARALEALIETGKATWYGLRHSHHYTVSGERFDPSQLTAAHRSLPIGALVRVTDRDTGRSVVVRVNDREPPHGSRCIDLSEGAAQALGIRQQGVANVAISSVTPDDAVEVAEAPDDTAPRSVARPFQAPSPATARHGLRHRRHAAP